MQRVNQPDRLSIDSFMDTQTQTNGEYYTFVNHAPNTALVGATKIHLLRCSIPNIVQPLPDYQLVFYYYKLPNASTIPAAQYLHAVRLYPNDYVPPAGFTDFTLNTFFQTATDLVALLNAAASTGGDSITYNTIWDADDVEFTFDTSTDRIFFDGKTAGAYYCSAGYNDPIVQASQASNTITTNNFDGTQSRQPYALGYTLNLRCGYSMDGVNIPKGSGTNLLSVKCANLTGTSFQQFDYVPSDTYPDLVYTSNVYLYSNIVGNSGYGSVNKKNLLAVIPINVPPGGIAQYDGHSAPAYATKVASEIYSVDVEMRDDANQPFYLPDSANVNLEISILYE